MATKTTLWYGLLLACSLSLQSCEQKDDPVLESGTPLFTIWGTIDNTGKKYAAGKNDYYMYTDYNLSTDGVYQCIGDMKQTCTDCKESLRITINNYQPGTDPVVPEQIFNKGEYYYKPPAGVDVNSAFQVNLVPFPSGNGTPSHLWNFGDGTFSTDPNPVKTYTTGRVYDIQYTATYPGGCSSSISMPVYAQKYEKLPPIVSIAYTLIDTVEFNTYEFEATVFDTATFSDLTWDFGDSLGTVSSTLPVQHRFNRAGVFTVMVVYVRNGRDVVVSKVNVPAKNDPSSCIANFGYSLQYVPNPLNLSTITVEWTDETGKKYSSESIEQDNNSDFFISNQKPYINNERGQKTRILDVIFNCKLSNGTETIELRDMKGHVAVGHP